MEDFPDYIKGCKLPEARLCYVLTALFCLLISPLGVLLTISAMVSFSCYLTIHALGAPVVKTMECGVFVSLLAGLIMELRNTFQMDRIEMQTMKREIGAYIRFIKNQKKKG